MAPETFPGSPESISRVRQEMGAFLGGDVSDDVAEVAVLLVSELATNAVRHAHSTFTVSAALWPGNLKVEVEDGSDQLPELRHPERSSEAGRGMFMVEALSSRWGAEVTAAGKRVWFELPLR